MVKISYQFQSLASIFYPAWVLHCLNVTYQENIIRYYHSYISCKNSSCMWTAVLNFIIYTEILLTGKPQIKFSFKKRCKQTNWPVSLFSREKSDTYVQSGAAYHHVSYFLTCEPYPSVYIINKIPHRKSLYGIYTVVVLYEKSHSFASLTFSLVLIRHNSCVNTVPAHFPRTSLKNMRISTWVCMPRSPFNFC